MQEDGLPVTRRLGKADVARNDDLIKFLRKEFFDLLCDLFGNERSSVIHGQHDALNLERLVQVLPNKRDGVHQLRKSFQRIIFALDGDDRAVCRRQRVDGQKPQRRRTVDENVIKLLLDGQKRGTQYLVAVLFVDEIHLRPRQIDIGR